MGVVAILYRRDRRRGSSGALTADVAAGGVLFLLTLGFFWRTLSGDVFQPADGGDLVSFLYPTYRFSAQTLASGALPLWNPRLYAGAPFLGDIQSGFFYPPNLLLFLLWPDFPYQALQWMSILHLWWAGLGVYVLVRTLRPGGRQIGAIAALTGAIAFTFCDPLLIHLGNLNLIAVLSWAPWALAAFVRAGRNRSLAWAALAGALLALGSYAGHAQSTLLAGMALVVYAFFDWAANASEPGRWRRAGWAALGLAVAGVTAGLLLAPILLPAIELAGQSVRSQYTYQDSVGYSLAPAQWIGAITPGFFGRGPALHWSLWQRVELPYVGLVALLMAIAAVLMARPAERRALVPWIGMALVGLALAMGIYGILHGWLTVVAPWFGSLRAPARAVVLSALGISVLAAVGVDALIVWARERRAIEGDAGGSTGPGDASLPTPVEISPLRRFLGGGALLLVAIGIPLGYLSLLLTQSDETAFLRASVALLALALAAAFWVGAWLCVEGLRTGWFGGTVFGALIAALLYFELAATGAYTDVSPQDPTTGFDQQAIVDFLRADPDHFRIDTRTDIEALWQPDTAALYGLDDVGGIANPLGLTAWDEYWSTMGGRDSDAYNLLNVKYVIARDGTPFPDNFELAFDAPGDLSVFRNTAVYPRAFLAQPGAPDGATVLPSADAGSVQILESSPDRIRLQTDANADALLVLSELWYPGWRATVDGAALPVEKVDGILRGVRVPAGQSQVVVEYVPSGLRTGALLLAAGVALALIALLIDRRRQHRKSMQEIAQ